MNNEKIMI